jgi:uncharacterized DUF497 family protein
MEFDFDPAKDEANRFKHGLRLEFGRRVFDDPMNAILPSIKKVYGEDRFKAVGMVGGKLYTVVYVWRENVIRLISVRRSNPSEQRDYDSYPG